MQIGPGCVTYFQIAIAVPASGTVLVQAQVWVAIDHTSGTRDLANLKVTSGGGCGLSTSTVPVDVPAGAPTAIVFFGTYSQAAIPVTAGTYTFYFTGVMGLGGNAGDSFSYGNMAAVFYPS